RPKDRHDVVSGEGLEGTPIALHRLPRPAIERTPLAVLRLQLRRGPRGGAAKAQHKIVTSFHSPVDTGASPPRPAVVARASRSGLASRDALAGANIAGESGGVWSAVVTAATTR